MIKQRIDGSRARAAAERLFVKWDVCFSKGFQQRSMKSRVLPSPQLHQSAPGIRFFNHFIRFDQISDKCYVASATEDRSVRELRVTGRADHGAGKFTTPGNDRSGYSGGAASTTSLTISRANFVFRQNEDGISSFRFFQARMNLI